MFLFIAIAKLMLSEGWVIPAKPSKVHVIYRYTKLIDVTGPNSPRTTAIEMDKDGIGNFCIYRDSKTEARSGV